MEKNFGTALGCIDGRTILPITNWMKENFNVNYVDFITEPGMDKVLSQNNIFEINRLKENVIISITAHASNVVTVSGHYDCAANPVSDCKHFQDIIASVKRVESWQLPVIVVGLWVDKFGIVYVVRKNQ